MDTGWRCCQICRCGEFFFANSFGMVGRITTVIQVLSFKVIRYHLPENSHQEPLPATSIATLYILFLIHKHSFLFAWAAPIVNLNLQFQIPGRRRSSGQGRGGGDQDHKERDHRCRRRQDHDGREHDHVGRWRCCWRWRQSREDDAQLCCVGGLGKRCSKGLFTYIVCKQVNKYPSCPFSKKAIHC